MNSARPRASRSSRCQLGAVAAKIAVLAAAASMVSTTPASAAGPLAKDRAETAAKGALHVTSAAFAPNAALPAKYSAQAGNRSPPLQWSRAAGANSFALILEDPDAPAASPHVHWVAWNIPASVSSLPEGVPSAVRVTAPVPMLQGRNSAQTTGYSGPRPPAGDSAHHYHFEVFAIDSMLKTPPPGSDRDAVIAAMRGHVLAKGDLVVTYRQK